MSETQQTGVYPAEVMEVAQKIVSSTQIPMESVLKEYAETLQQIKVTFPTDFKTDADLHHYASQLLWAQYKARGPTTELSVVPYGYDGIRLTKRGDKQCHVYVAIRGPSGPEKKMITLTGAEAEMYKNITLGALYNVKVIEWKSGQYGADNRCRFENPQATNTDILSLVKRLGAVEVPTLAEAPHLASRLTPPDNKYVDSFDLRIIRGIIATNPRQSVRKDGTPFGVYNLNDTSLGNEEKVNAEGKIVPPLFTVWIDPNLMAYGADSEIYAYGTIGVNQKGEASMNAFGVVAIHGVPLPPK